MPRWLPLTLALVTLAPGQDADLKQALALEKTIQKVIADVEPSVCCVLVSRSDLYGRFGQGPAADNPGKLGAFDAQALQAHPLYGQLSAADQKMLLAKLDLADAARPPEASGSGVVIDERGLVLTPYHVVAGAAKVYVLLAGNEGTYADIYAADPRSDLAVLRLLRPKLALKAAKLGDGGKAARGQFVIGLAATVAPGFRHAKPSTAWGVISNVRQRLPAGADEEKGKTIHQYGSLLQTDVRMNLATTGGVLLDLRGEVIGLMNTLAAIAGPDAAGGFAMPVDEGLRGIIAVLKKGEEVEYGFLGVSFEAPTAKPEGAVLRAVTEGSPAEVAGLKSGHVILAVNDQPVETNDDLLRALATQQAGVRVKLEVRKPGMAREKVEVVLAKYLVAGKVIATERGARPFFRGLRVDYTSLIAQQPSFTAGSIPRGVLVTEVAPDSAAAKADLKPGFVISHVNDRAVTTPAAFYEIVLNHKGPVELTLHAAEPGQPAAKVILP